MNSEEKIKLMHCRLQEAFPDAEIIVQDESDQHLGHANHEGGGRHFAIEIKDGALSRLPKVNAHRKVYALFTDLIPNEIHALRIKIH